jgi:hypothetical protein
MQGAGYADELAYFKCPRTKQMRCPASAYKDSAFGDKAKSAVDIMGLPCQRFVAVDVAHPLRHLFRLDQSADGDLAQNI